MRTWSVETVGGGVLRRAGAPGGPALWFVHARSFSGGHRPMIEDPEATAQQIASFFERIVAGRSA